MCLKYLFIYLFQSWNHSPWPALSGLLVSVQGNCISQKKVSGLRVAAFPGQKTENARLFCKVRDQCRKLFYVLGHWVTGVQYIGSFVFASIKSMISIDVGPY